MVKKPKTDVSEAQRPAGICPVAMGRRQLWPAAGPCHGVRASGCLGQRAGPRGSLGGAGLQVSGQLKCRAHRGVNLGLLAQNFSVADQQ